ncbi:MAG: hypothetical protein ACREOV_06140, partial [Candidatus Dormibacteraceae bacterium]
MAVSGRDFADLLDDERTRQGFSLRRAYRDHFGHSPRYERMFIASVAFFLGFGTARTVTHMIRAQVGPFGNMSVGGRHLH